MVGIKTTGEQMKYQSFATMEPYLTNPGKKLDWPSKDTLESEIIQNRPPTKLTIGLGNRLSGVYMQNSTNTTVNQGLMGVHKVNAFHPFIFQKSGKSTIKRNLAVPRHFVAYLVFISSIRVDPGPRNIGPTSLLALKIRTPVASMGKLRPIGQVPVDNLIFLSGLI
jgi:hypothetical protein